MITDPDDLLVQAEQPGKGRMPGGPEVGVFLECSYSKDSMFD